MAVPYFCIFMILVCLAGIATSSYYIDKLRKKHERKFELEYILIFSCIFLIIFSIGAKAVSNDKVIKNNN